MKRGETLEEDKHWLTFHPVALKVFPAQPTVIVLSHIPGRVATHGKMFAMNSSSKIHSVTYTTSGPMA